MSDISKKIDNAESPLAFSLPLLFCPLLILGWIYGGIMLIFAPIFGYVIISIIDLFIGENKKEQILNSENINNYKIYYIPLEQALHTLPTDMKINL